MGVVRGFRTPSFDVGFLYVLFPFPSSQNSAEPLGLLRKDPRKAARSQKLVEEKFLVRRMSETPTTTTSQKSIAIRLPFVLQYASHLYCSGLDAPTL